MFTRTFSFHRSVKSDPMIYTCAFRGFLVSADKLEEEGLQISVLREENSLVDRFTFDILVHFVESLSIAHVDEKSLGTQDQCKKALEHLEKIIRLRADLLRKESTIRAEPAEWSKRTLDIAVRWLTRQCGRTQTECRHACMKLVYQLAPLIQGINTPIDYFQVGWYRKLA